MEMPGDGGVTDVDGDRLADGAIPDSDGSMGIPCGFSVCSPGQRCEVGAGGETCVNNECADLRCAETERCEVHPAGGHVCVDASCESNVDCVIAEYCNGTICVPDICTPGMLRCDGEQLFSCDSSGGEDLPRYACGSPSPFPSTCVDEGMGSAGCSCEDEWDCPAHTLCDVGSCVGTGLAPTCTLPAVPFADVPPTVEIHWGGDSIAAASAHDGTAARNPAPWPSFSHVLGTPIVANLDDDNGDGLINELDFPEILFTAHKGNNPWANGVVRAIHGGGPDKGADYFARCGTELWTRSSPTAAGCSDDAPDADSGVPVAVGDLDNDGVPEIVYMTENNRFVILDNTGAEIFRLGSSWSPTTDGETAAIANLDHAGYAEIIVGRTVYLLTDDMDGNLMVSHVLDGVHGLGRNGVGRMACPADLDATHPGEEIVAGATLYRLPDVLPTCGTPPCAGALEVVWNAPDLPGQSGRLSGDGFCAVADVWGADHGAAPGPSNRPDGVPEVILIDDGQLTILDGATGAIIDDRGLGGGARGGAPNVDDFDGDGFMEIASALQDFYMVVDLQEDTGAGGSCPAWPAVIERHDRAGGAHNSNPSRSPGGACTMDSDCDPAAVCNTIRGQCVCLHNGWRRDSDDDSSRATSSSVFDFNGDGAAEVLYNDECDFRVYDGTNGEIYFFAMSRSRTGIENPVVADVDNDGNAEVVVAMNTAQNGRCDEDTTPRGPNGINVWGDPTDTWVSARRIWNQQSYHVTNVTERGGIPAHAPPSWGVFNDRYYNTYRSQPRNFGVAPDLTVVDVGVSSPDAGCGALSDIIDIAFEVRNEGDLRVGPGVVVRFVGIWGTEEEELLDGAGDPLEVVLGISLEPGRSVIESVNYHQSYNGRGRLPDRVRVILDPPTTERPSGAERECREDNNQAESAVDAGIGRADLRVEITATATDCPDGLITVTLANDGSVDAGDVVLRFYAGDPRAGGTALHDETVAGPIAAGSTRSLMVRLPRIPASRDLIIYVVADPEGTIEECNRANNLAGAAEAIRCSGLI